MIKGKIMEKLYPLAQVAAELDCGVRDVVKRANGSLVRDEYGFRCIRGDVAAEWIAERDQKLAARREAARQDAERCKAVREARQARLGRQRQAQAQEQAAEAKRAALIDAQMIQVAPRYSEAPAVGIPGAGNKAGWIQ
jgi:hypothetical protein